LSKGIKDEVQFVPRDPNSRVRNTKLDGYTLDIECKETGAERDVPFTRDFGRSELDGVPDKVRNNLSQSE
jgi:hypothetical protein